MKAVVAKGDTYNVYDLAVSLKVLTDARNFLVKFEAAPTAVVPKKVRRVIFLADMCNPLVLKIEVMQPF